MAERMAFQLAKGRGDDRVTHTQHGSDAGHTSYGRGRINRYASPKGKAKANRMDLAKGETTREQREAAKARSFVATMRAQYTLAQATILYVDGRYRVKLGNRISRESFATSTDCQAAIERALVKVRKTAAQSRAERVEAAKARHAWMDDGIAKGVV